MKTIKLNFENGLCLIGVLETIKRLGKPKYSKKASEYLDEYFTHYNYMSSSIPVNYINNLENFFNEYYDEFGNEGVVSADALLIASYFLQNYDSDIKFNGQSLLDIMTDWYSLNQGKIKADEN